MRTWQGSAPAPQISEAPATERIFSQPPFSKRGTEYILGGIRERFQAQQRAAVFVDRREIIGGIGGFSMSPVELSVGNTAESSLTDTVGVSEFQHMDR